MGSQDHMASRSQPVSGPSAPVGSAEPSASRDFNAEARVVERVYRLADALRGAEKALDGVPSAGRGGRSDLDALLDKPLYPGDLDVLAKSVREIADAWQSDIDAEDGV